MYDALRSSHTGCCSQCLAPKQGHFFRDAFSVRLYFNRVLKIQNHVIYRSSYNQVLLGLRTKTALCCMLFLCPCICDIPKLKHLNVNKESTPSDQGTSYRLVNKSYTTVTLTNTKFLSGRTWIVEQKHDTNCFKVISTPCIFNCSKWICWFYSSILCGEIFKKFLWTKRS